MQQSLQRAEQARQTGYFLVFVKQRGVCTPGGQRKKWLPMDPIFGLMALWHNYLIW